MAKKQRKYDMEYKIKAVKSAKEPSGAKAAAGLKSLPRYFQHLAAERNLSLYNAVPGFYGKEHHSLCRIMEEIGLSHRPKHRPNGITKAGREARKSEDIPDGLM